MQKKFIKIFSNKGIATIEASLAFTFFIVGYIILNSLIISLSIQSEIRKALTKTTNELSGYIQIMDKINIIDKIKTQKFDKDKYLNLFKDEIKEDFLADLKNLLVSDFGEYVKSKSYNSILKNIFLKNLNKSSDYLSKVGILNGIDGIDFSESSILEDGETIKLNLQYQYNTGKYGIFEKTRKIILNSGKKVWISHGLKYQNTSIWEKANFERGKWFLDFYRKESSLVILKQGKGIDVYIPSTNTVQQVYSLNIFSNSYSFKESGNIKINSYFLKTIENYFNKMKANTKKYSGEVETVDSQKVNINNPNYELVIILPEEALNITEIENHRKKLENKHGKITFIYKEKAFKN